MARGALQRTYQDTPFTHPCFFDEAFCLGPIHLEEGEHTLMVKVFQGTGQHNFRVGFLDDVGNPIPGGPEEIEVSNTPSEAEIDSFLRGDCNADGEVNISDATCILNWLFAGEADPG